MVKSFIVFACFPFCLSTFTLTIRSRSFLSYRLLYLFSTPMLSSYLDVFTSFFKKNPLKTLNLTSCENPVSLPPFAILSPAPVCFSHLTLLPNIRCKIFAPFFFQFSRFVLGIIIFIHLLFLIVHNPSILAIHLIIQHHIWLVGW